ncbi:MAG: PKD domain-containing protein, partial [Methanoregula sp.]
TSTVKNPVHTFEATGNYTVILTATNDLGSDTKTATEYIIVSGSAAPVAAISANKTSWSAPASIQFYDRSTGFPTSWAWDFGDGATSTVKNPVHTFEATGNYTVILTATNDLGSDTKTATDYIIVSGSAAPVAAISANKTSWSSPAAIQFYDRSTGFPTSWIWDFGDGATSTLKNPVHTYTATGNYTVNLTVTNEVGSDTKVAADYIKVSGSAAPVAAISANKTSWSSPAAIQFYDRSAGFPTAWAWDFGDGTTANVKNPVHTYTGIGNFTVNLTVTNEVGSDTKVVPDYIRVSVPEIPVAKISANRTAGSAPIVIQFYDRSIGFPTEWLWDFGDGNMSALKNPVHTYAYGGNYTITLRATNALGNTSVTALNYIKASGSGPVVPVAADFTANATSGPVPLAVAFTDISTGSPTSWNWSFGDGTFAEVQNPVHTYAAAGNYSVSLAASNAESSDSRTRADYIVVQSATSAFDASVESSTVSSDMFQGEHYLVDIRMNNTGTRAWSGNPASPDYVYLEVVGGSTGDGAKFNLTQIPMLFVNETVAPGEGYDFFFFMEAPEIIGNYSPAFQMTSASQGSFGEIPNSSVSVIENPFNPVVQPDGSKLYTTTFGNLSSGMTVSIVGPKVYLDKLQTSSYQDPRFLINPALKSGVFDFKLNDTFNYADITVKYDPAKVTTPANLSISYFNTTTGNFTFVPSSVDTVNHTVTARVTHFSIYEILDQIKYMALPFLAQNEMGYMDMGSNDNWTINPPLGSISGASFKNGENFPPGNYTIYTSGTYSNNYLDFAGTCYGGWASADSNFDSWSGMYIVYNNPNGLSERQVQTVRNSTGILKITHGGGPIRMYNRPVTGRSCGAVSYKMYYTQGPVLRDPLMDYSVTLLNNAVFLKQAGFEGAYHAFLQGIGCLIGRMDKRGNSIVQSLPSMVNNGPFLGLDIIPLISGNDVQSPTDFLIGYATCGLAPLSDFSGDPTSGAAPLTVQFTDNSIGVRTSWLWDFGDGTTSAEQNPSHTYNSARTYTVKLTVSNLGGSNTRSRDGYITVTATPGPVADFRGTPVSGTEPLMVQFTDESTGSPTSWAWDFNNDGTTDSTVQNPAYTYTTAGSYTIKLTATNAAGSTSKVKLDYVTVLSSGAMPQASDYDFDNFGLTNTAPSASDAASIQNSAGYQSSALTDSNSQTAYNRLQDDAIFMFIGHGVADITGDTGGGLKFKDKNQQFSYITAYPSSYPGPYIANLQENQLSKARLVVLLGCFTGDTSRTRGNLVTAFSQKGAKNVIGWNGDQETPQLKSWSTHFWARANNGESFYSAAHNAAADAVQDFPLGGWMINNYVYESSGGDSYLKPAGYGN